MGIVHFDPTWTGTESGTFEQPYVSWASRTHQVGDSWVQKYGTTTTDPYAPFGVLGDEANRRFVGVYDHITGAIMRGVKGGAFIDATGKTYGANITEARGFITMSGFEIFGATSACIYKASTASSSTEVQSSRFENLILRNSLGAGADLRGASNKVLNCDIYDNASDGLFIVGDGFELGWTDLWNNGTTKAEGDCVQLLDSSNWWIHDSDLDHSLSPYKQALISTLLNVAGTTGGRIESSRIACAQFVDGVTAADQKTLQIITPGVKVQRCTIEGGQFGAYLQGVGSVLEDCLLVVTGSGLVVGVAVRENNVAVRRNTVIGGGGAYGIDHSSTDFSGVTINGNALRNWAAGIRTHTGATYSHNAFEECALRNSNSAGAEGAAGTGDKVGSLELSSGYRPKPASPIMRVGTHLAYARDRDGKRRPNPPSIGAFDVATLRTPHA